MELDLASFFTSYGQPGLYVGAAIILFRYLLTRSDQLAKENLEDLRRQVRHWTNRALRAELILRAYLRAEHPIPEEEVATEIRLSSSVDGLFPEMTKEHTD